MYVVNGRQTDGVQALRRGQYPWTDNTWAGQYPWTHCRCKQNSFTFMCPGCKQGVNAPTRHLGLTKGMFQKLYILLLKTIPFLVQQNVGLVSTTKN